MGKLELRPEHRTHWQVHLEWVSGGTVHHGGAWIGMDEAPTWAEAIEVCKRWRDVPADAVFTRLEVVSGAAVRPARIT